jgi:hypothetical protein
MLDKVLFFICCCLHPSSTSWIIQHDKSHLFILLQLGSAFCCRKWILFLWFFWWLPHRPSVLNSFNHPFNLVKIFHCGKLSCMKNGGM